MAALHKLIATADVFVHSLRPKAIEKLGLGYEAVRALRPDIIYCGAYGFGKDGPYRDKAAYDDIIQAGSGLAALHKVSRGEPAFMPTVLCDKLSGQAIAYAVIAALFQRERGGGGQAIEVPMFETTAEFAYIEHLLGFAFEPAARNDRLCPRRQPAPEAVPHRGRLRLHPALLGPQLARFLRLRRQARIQDRCALLSAHRTGRASRDALRDDRCDGADALDRRVGGFLRRGQHPLHAGAQSRRTCPTTPT